MRAVVVHAFGGPDALAVEERPDPIPGAGEVLVRVGAVAVNFVDSVVIAGRYQFSPALPFTPGKGPAGTVVALGDGVTGFAVGDRVLAMAEIGGYAELALAPADQCYALPPALSFADAAAMSLAYDTAWFGLHERGRVQRGETVLVLGATGAVGFAAMQLARAAGARVLAGVSSMAKAGLARDGGADAVIDLGAEGLHDGLRDQVLAANGGKGCRRGAGHAGRRHLRRGLARGGLARARRGDRVRSRADPDGEGQLPHGKEHRGERPTDQRLPQTPTRFGAALLRGGVRVVREPARSRPPRHAASRLRTPGQALAAMLDRSVPERVLIVPE